MSGDTCNKMCLIDETINEFDRKRSTYAQDDNEITWTYIFDYRNTDIYARK